MTEAMEVLQVPAELEAMVALFQERQPKRILEIGCWDGGTLREWLQNAPAGATVVAVDLEHRNAEAYEAWRKPDTELHLYTGKSQDEAQVAAMQRHAPYDWVFIDGDHGTWGVTLDVQNTKPLVAPGGLMLLHDITPPIDSPSYPPLDVFRELSAELKTWAFQYDEPRPWSAGIGVVQL